MINSKIESRDFQESFESLNGFNGSISEILELIDQTQAINRLDVNKISLEMINEWLFDKVTHDFVHNSGKFFKLTGCKHGSNLLPIILQPEVGILGFICSKLNGVLHFLVQLKNEPGNPSGVQISPTVQATKSNYSQVHGGKLPEYLEYFINDPEKKTIISIEQSEQAWRYFQKKNENIIIFEEQPPSQNNSHLWMTLGQIRELSKIPLLINSCTRSVLSHINFKENSFCKKNNYLFSDKDILKSFEDIRKLKETSKIVPLVEIKNWERKNGCFKERHDNNFRFIGIDIKAQGREVSEWQQPILEEKGKGEYGLIAFKKKNEIYFLWKIRSEPGFKFGSELGPSWINRSSQNEDSLWAKSISRKSKVVFEIEHSEEGGRFFNSIFNHKICFFDKFPIEEISPEYIPLSIEQTLKFINKPDFFSQEARSIWFFVEESLFE